jgi:hypothetical protein
MLFQCKSLWVWSKKFETCCNISRLFVKVYILIAVNLLVLSTKLFVITRMWILLRVQIFMSCGLAELVMKYLRAAHIVPLFGGAKRQSLCWTAVYNTPSTRPMDIGGKKWQEKIEVPRENPILVVFYSITNYTWTSLRANSNLRNECY